MKQDIVENHKHYLKRLDFYKSFGYDLEKERDFVYRMALPFTGRILEIGTGKGHFTLALAAQGFRFTTIDISDQDQITAKLNLRYFGLEKQVKMIIADAQKTGFPDKHFDTIFSVNVLHHLRNPKAVLSEITRILGPCGKVVLCDFNKKGMDIINRCHAHEGKKHDSYGCCLDDAEKYFLKKSFTVSRFHGGTQEGVIAVPRQRVET
ncbi:MAG: class I SAM-dependent methyltransferase [Candidatus Omnitrophica bacterium]|nr:class I SAM-dependent methyltransferase [Candidatus Omnitrophota bacterium]